MTTDTVLIVDDSLTVRMDLQEAFEEAGFGTHVCATAAAAREAIAAGAADVVVLDVLLPDGDGVELLKEVRASATASGAVVLMLSSEAEVKDRVRGLLTGADEYVGKPYDTHYVIDKARELLRAKRATAVSRGPSTILLIDDSRTFRESLRHAFETAGYKVLLAASGEEGLRVAAAERPSAIVVDSVLPGVDGATVIRRVRLDTALRAVPCLLLTASDERDVELSALDAGADAFVRKDDDVELILARIAAVLRSAATSAPDRVVSLLGPKRILAVDDSPTYLAELASMLRDEGYDVVPARSGDEALGLLAVQSMDCILLDLMMPGLNGRDICHRIKSAPVLRDIPLLMLASNDDRDVMLDALEAGADDYIQKSSEFKVLKARVRAQLRRKQFEDDNRRVRMELQCMEREAAQTRAARELADSRAELLSALEQKHHALEAANIELARANKAKTDFLSTMSHELRTPLNAIIGFSEILNDGIGGELAPRQREYVTHIHESGKHLLSLINDILDLSKIEAGKVELDLEPIDVDALLVDALNVVKERAAVHQVRLKVSGLDRPELVRVDRRRLRQIVYNLLSNAVKFTPDGGQVTLEASLVDRQQAANGLPGFEVGLRMPLPDNEFDTFVQISVSDTGIGISRDDLARLFMPFTQIHTSFTSNTEGTGLGLVTVSRLAQLHGGCVAVTSQPGRGSCFSLWLPWRTVESLQDAEDKSTKPLALVVEDDFKAATLMRIQLEAAGFQVRHCVSAELALGLAGECRPDLITLDIRLPGMDGWDFLCRIKDIPSWSDIPVVVVSVVAHHEIGLSLGASAVLQKPINRNEFAHELQKVGIRATAAKKPNVLLVDDDRNAVELMSVHLGQLGYSVLRAYGGQEGIELAQRHLPDLVVVDLLMPDIGGIEVVEALKRDRTTAAIPVIMVTAKQFSDEDRQQLNSHVLSVVDKSDFHQGRFLGEVRRAFGKSVELLQEQKAPLPLGEGLG